MSDKRPKSSGENLVPKLTPPDYERCQAEKSNGVNFMTFGGRREMIRCTKPAKYLATETKPNPKDGMIGSMTVCEECCEAMKKQVPGIVYRLITSKMVREWKREQVEQELHEAAGAMRRAAGPVTGSMSVPVPMEDYDRFFVAYDAYEKMLAEERKRIAAGPMRGSGSRRSA